MTAQVHEELILNGNKVEMSSAPPLPDDHPRIVECDFDYKAYENVKYGEEDFAIACIGSTACWRGYIGTWEIKDNCLYLVNLRGHKKLEGSEPLLAEWFSGELRLNEGELLLYVHMGFGSVFEFETRYKIETGRVKEVNRIDNRGKKFSRDELALKNLPYVDKLFPEDDGE